MLSEKLGHVFDKPLKGIVRFIPFSPNAITVVGFMFTLLASYILLSNLLLGGIMILLGGVFDILDGVVARNTGKSSKFGAFLDSVLDRYSDAFILLALAWNFLDHKDNIMLLVCLGALVGSLLISYARARAEGLGENCTYGLMERPERIILLAFGAITGMIIPVLWVLLVLTHFTVLQRIYFVRKVSSGM